MHSFPDIPTITLHPLSPGAGAALRFNVLPALAPPPPIAAAIDQVWDELKAAHPRLFDGPIVLTDTGAAVLNADSPNGLPARRATYKTLATAAEVGMTVRALGVQGIVTARDAAGNEHLLLGRRGGETRIYQGLWENAPSGTIAPPAAAQTSLALADFTKALIDEGLEETGLDLAAARITPIALLDDAEAQSLDIVLRVVIPDPINPVALPCPQQDHARWEYADAAWIATSQLKDWAARNTHAISPPTLAVLRWMRWA